MCLRIEKPKHYCMHFAHKGYINVCMHATSFITSMLQVTTTIFFRSFSGYTHKDREK